MNKAQKIMASILPALSQKVKGHKLDLYFYGYTTEEIQGELAFEALVTALLEVYKDKTKQVLSISSPPEYSFIDDALCVTLYVVDKKSIVVLEQITMEEILDIMEINCESKEN